MTYTELRQEAKRHGLFVSCWAPGDGVRRIRFFHDPHSYFSDGYIYTALGTKEAGIWLAGYAAGADRMTWEEA